jgi:hypothetical protein
MSAVKQRKKSGGRDWLPGQSGNPAGRPPNERALSNALRGVVDPVEYARILWGLARGVDPEDGLRAGEPSLPALKLIIERLEGLAVASVALDATVNPRLEILAELKRIGFQDPMEPEAENDA